MAKVLISLRVDEELLAGVDEAVSADGGSRTDFFVAGAREKLGRRDRPEAPLALREPNVLRASDLQAFAARRAEAFRSRRV